MAVLEKSCFTSAQPALNIRTYGQRHSGGHPGQTDAHAMNLPDKRITYFVALSKVPLDLSNLLRYDDGRVHHADRVSSGHQRSLEVIAPSELNADKRSNDATSWTQLQTKASRLLPSGNRHAGDSH